jgi:hypothetical protein
VIARLNDLAFKAIKTGTLNKLMDKRAMTNEDLYQRLDRETYDIVSKLDIPKIEAEQKSLIEEVGDCIYSCQNTLDLIQEGDCMCLGLSISRPEAAIADPTRLVIKEITTTYISADSFLNSAKFNLE